MPDPGSPPPSGQRLDPLSDMLARRGVLLADGATGTNLFNMGLRAGAAPEFLNTDAPDQVRALYRGAVQAGSDLFLTNSFGANASRLQPFGAAGRVAELNRAGAELAREVADRADRPVLVAGSMGPTGQILAPMGNLSLADAVAIYHEQAEALKSGGADLLWFETLSAPEELRAAADAAARAGMAWAVTMSFDTGGRTMMGVGAADMVRLVNRLTWPPVAFGANCGLGAADLLRTVLGFAALAPVQPLIAKGNAGIPQHRDGQIHYTGTPQVMANYAVLARDAGVSVIGGCCGTTPAHLAAMRAALDSRPRGERPTLDRIAAELGGFSTVTQD